LTFIKCHFDLGGFVMAQGEMIAFDKVLGWVAKGGNAFGQDDFAFQDTHFRETPSDPATAPDVYDGGLLARKELVERH
jgi:hypothetical protein